MTWLLPLIVSLLIIGLVHTWVKSTFGPDVISDPVGFFIAFGAYGLAVLLAIIVWLVWALVA